MIDVEEHLNLVHMVLQKEFHTSPLSFLYADYYSVGCIGLVYAGVHFKPEYGFKFSTYAVPLIIGYIKKFRREQSFPMKHTKKSLDVIMKYYAVSNRGYTDEEISVKLEITLKELNDIKLEFENNILLDNESINDGDNINRHDLISDPKANFEDNLVADMDFKDMLELLRKLHPPVYRVIYLMIYGIKSQKIIGEITDFSQAQISRLIKIFRERIYPAINQYMDGEINYDHLKYIVKYYQRKEEIPMQPELYVMLKNYMTNNIDRPLNITKFINHSEYTYNSTVPYYVKLLLKEFERDGYVIERLGRANIIRRPGFKPTELQPLEEFVEENKDIIKMEEVPPQQGDPYYNTGYIPPIKAKVTVTEKNILHLKIVDIPDISTLSSLIDSFSGCLPEELKGKLTVELKIS